MKLNIIQEITKSSIISPMKCPICSTFCDPFTDISHQVEYHSCPTCSTIFKSPLHHAGLSEQKIRYDLHDNDPDDPGYRAYFQRFLDWLLPQTPQRGRVLDFGCGASDLLASMLTKEGFDATRYDPIYYPDKSYRDKTYDLIVSTEVFEHLSDPLSSIQDLANLLKPGGHLGLQTQFCPMNTDLFLDWYYRLDPTHITFFTTESFRVMGKKSGLIYISDDAKNKVLLQR